MFEFLCDNLLIICPNSYKLAILKYLNDNKLIFNIKFMTILEYKKHLLFDYDVNAVHYLVKKGMKVDNAITILNNLYYIENKKYNNSKLDYLVNIKKELDNNNLLIYDNLFSKVLKRRKIVVYGYGTLNSFDSKLLDNSMVIPYDVNDKKYDIYHFKNIFEEVEFIFQKISDLLENGIDINNISLMNINQEYLPYLKLMEKFYDIKIDLNNSDNLMGTIIGKMFFNLVSLNKNKDEIFKELDVFKDSIEYGSIINLLNKYNDDLFCYIDEIKYDLLNTKIKKESFENTIRVKNVFDYIDNDEYVFLMNFNNSSIPKLKMDTDYITDDICALVGVDKCEEENELIKSNTLKYLSGVKNIIISYKDTSSFNEYGESILLDYMDYEIKEYERKMNYSDLANKSLYTTYLDDLVKYGTLNNDLNLLYSNYDTNNYLEYNNSFNGLSKNSLIKYLNNELSLSYSSIDNYYKCSFKYYLENILKLNIFEETFSIFIGKLFHYVLSKMNEDDFDFDREYNCFIKEHEFNYKEKFFLEKLKKDLLFIIDTIKKHQFISGFTNMLYEHKIDIKLMDSPYVHFKGFVDKVMYKEKNNETLVSIIDYKTGKVDIKIKNLKFGLSMQLPIYLYLVNHSDLLKNIKFTGFYLEHILDLNVMKKDNKSIDEIKHDNLKLTGYTTDNINRLSIFDSTYQNSEMIKGMKITKDGSISKLANTLSDSEIDEILKLTESKIKEAIEKILAGDFSINPKILNRENVSCQYCKYNDICYYTEKDLIYLTNDN